MLQGLGLRILVQGSRFRFGVSGGDADTPAAPQGLWFTVQALESGVEAPEDRA
jgi:hypothetical protein